MARQSAINPWQRFTESLSAGNYPGSSGYWGFPAASRYPYSQQGPNEYGLYPGDAAKANLARLAGVQAPAGLAGFSRNGGRVAPGLSASIASNTNTQTGNGAESLYNPIQVLKSPTVAAGVKSLADKFAAGTGDIPGFDELMAGLKGAGGTLKNAFDREQRSFDLSGFAAGQRGADANASALTGNFASTARDIGSRYTQSDEDYARKLDDIVKRAYGGLEDYDKAANAIGDEQTKQLMGNIARYKIGGGNLGLGSDELRKIARGVGDIRLPLEREKIAQRYNILTGVELPSDREVATRNAARLAGFELPMEQSLYGAQQGDILRAKGTEQQLKQLEMSVAGMSRASAESYLRSLALPAEVIQSVLSRHNQTLAGQISNLSGIGALEDQAYYRGLNYTPGASLSQPAYYTTVNPQYPAPQMPANTGTGSGAMNDAERNALIARLYQDQTGVPAGTDPNFSQSSWDRLAGLVGGQNA